MREEKVVLRSALQAAFIICRENVPGDTAANDSFELSSILPGVGKTFVNAILRNTITPLNDPQNSHF